jgi:hypothetical protein
MSREQRVMLRAGWLSFSLGTLISLTFNAGAAGCAAKPGRGPSPASPAAADHRMSGSDAESDPCYPPYLGATKAAPIVPPGCPGYENRTDPRHLSPEQAPRQAP